MNTAFFVDLFASLYTILQPTINQIVGNLLAYVRPALFAGLIAWVAFQSLAVVWDAASPKSLMIGLLRAAVIVTMLQSAATFDQYVVQLANAIPTELSNAAGGGGGMETGAIYDRVWGRNVKAGLLVYDALPSYSWKAVPLAAGVLAYVVMVFGTVGACALVTLASVVMLALLLAIGPVMLALYPFEGMLRGWCLSWISVVATTIGVQVLTAVILAMFIGIGEKTISTILASNGNMPTLDMMLILIQAGVLVYVVYQFLKQAPALSMAMFGRFHQSVGFAHRWTTGAMGQVANAVTGAVGRAGMAGARPAVAAASAAASSAINRSKQAVGRSLSRGL